MYSQRKLFVRNKKTDRSTCTWHVVTTCQNKKKCGFFVTATKNKIKLKLTESGQYFDLFIIFKFGC